MMALIKTKIGMRCLALHPEYVQNGARALERRRGPVGSSTARQPMALSCHAPCSDHSSAVDAMHASAGPMGGTPERAGVVPV